jgi:mRNA-degrading endonuclease toxin of MazEF toxin-antitoxin module
MPLPKPEPGLVIPYVYLWRREFDAGEETGRKVRPGLIIVVIIKTATGASRVAVCPITTQAPAPDRAAVEVPQKVRAHLGLDAAHSWIICDEYNEFDWPGVDLGLTPKGADHFGYVPDALINRVRQEVLAARARGVPRNE